VASFLYGDELACRFFEEPRWRGFPYKHILFTDNRLWVDDAIVIQVRVVLRAVRAGDLLIRYLDPVNLTTGVAPLFAFVGPEEVRPPETTVDGGLVNDQRIFNVEPLIGEDRNDKILTCRPLVGPD